MIILYFMVMSMLNQRKQICTVSGHIQSKNSCLSKNLFQKPRKAFLYWFRFEKMLTEFSKDCCFWNRVVTFSQTYVHSPETILSVYPKQKPKVVFYRKYKNFRKDLSRGELENESNCQINNREYEIFLRTFLKILDKYAPMKKSIWGQIMPLLWPVK